MGLWRTFIQTMANKCKMDDWANTGEAGKARRQSGLDSGLGCHCSEEVLSSAEDQAQASSHVLSTTAEAGA